MIGEGIELRLGVKASSAEPRGDGYSLSFEDGTELRGNELLVATGRKPRVHGFGLDSAGIDPDGAKKGIEVDERMRAADGVWAIGDVTGIWPFTHVGKYQGRVAAADILGRDVVADYRAVPRVVFTDPQVAAVGEQDGPSSGTAQLESISRTSTYSREYDKHPGFLTVVSDGNKLIGAHAVGPEAGEWLQQATLAIKAEIPVEVLRQTIQPYPTFSEAFFYALKDLYSPDGSNAASMNPEITAENIKTWLPGTFPGDMAIEPVEIADDVSTGRMVVDKRHLHPGGFVHGGVWTALGDSVAAWATFRALPPNHDFTTIELSSTSSPPGCWATSSSARPAPSTSGGARP